MASYGYDANGNMATKTDGSNFWRYSWDYENRLTQASTRKQAVRYKYDALGRRVQRIVGFGNENTKFIYDGEDVLADDDAGTLTKYQNGLGIDDKLRVQTGGDVKYLLSDHVGSTNGLTDPTGSLTASTGYDAFGNATNSSFPSRYQFTGREYDGFSGHYYYRARFYDANLGRFISEDPIGFGGGDINLYGYVKNRPINRTDPLGLWDPGDWEAARQAAVTAAGAGGLAAGAGPYVAVGAGGLAVGYGIGYYPGQLTANAPWNPFVYGPFNPFGIPYNPYAAPQAAPQTASKPACQPVRQSTPFYRNPPLPAPFSSPNDDDPDDRRCKSQYEDDVAACRRLTRPADRAVCYAQAMERYANCLARRPLGPFPW